MDASDSGRAKCAAAARVDPIDERLVVERSPRDIDHQRLRGDALERRERPLEDRVAEDEEAHRARDLGAPFPEQALPLEFGQQLRELGRRARDDDPALVEERRHVARRAARRTVAQPRELVVVQPVEYRLRSREREPGERVEEVVPAPRPGRDLARPEDALLHSVGPPCPVRGRRNEGERRAAAAPHIALTRKRVQVVRTREAVGRQPLEQAPHRSEPRRPGERVAVPDGRGHVRRAARRASRRHAAARASLRRSASSAGASHGSRTSVTRPVLRGSR